MIFPRLDPTKPIRELDRNEIICFGAVPDSLAKPNILGEGNTGKIKKIVCGSNHCLILYENGELYGFGNNENGQLGLSPINQSQINELTAITINLNELAGYRIKDIAAGDIYSLILLTRNNRDYIVKFSLSKKDKYRMSLKDCQYVKIEKLPDEILNVQIERIYAHDQRQAFITANKFIYISGIDFEGFDLDEYIPITKENVAFKDLESFYMCRNSALYLDKNHNLYGIGDNTYGELGKKDMSTTKFNQINLGINKKIKIKQISNGARHILILLENGDLYCMGDNSEGQCFTYSLRLNTPTKVDCIEEKVEKIYSGETHNMIILESGRVLTWGDNFAGKLGINEESFSQTTPKQCGKLYHRNIYRACLGYQMTVIVTGRPDLFLGNN